MGFLGEINMLSFRAVFLATAAALIACSAQGRHAPSFWNCKAAMLPERIGNP